MAFNEQYAPVIAAVVEQQFNAGLWPSVTVRFPPSGPTIFQEWQGPPPSDDDINAACAAFAAAGGLAEKKKLDERAEAVDLLGGGNSREKLLRGVLLLILDELNLHAGRTNAILDAVDGATTLATLKTAVLAIANVPIRTKQQLHAAITTLINDGNAD